MCVAMAIKIWNNTRIEMNLEQNQQLLLKARMDALTSQINPHFLFNTLNTVSSLIRFDPDMARGVVLKLSNILRRLLRKHETFVPLREELEFIDDYLDIEVIRFGRDKLQIFKEIDEETLETFVPSMLLQPMVENSIKHGLAPRLEGGQIHLRTRQSNGRLLIEIEDNGMGISPERLAAVYGGGIGISNVHERLRLLYGDQFRMDIRSQEGQGHADSHRNSGTCHSRTLRRVVTDSFVAQGLHRIYFCGALGGNKAGAQRDDGQQRRDADKRQCVGWAHTEQKAGHQARQSKCAEHSDGDSEQRQKCSLFHHQPQHILLLRAEGHAQREFLGPACYRE